MGDVNLEIKLSNLDERVIKIEESGGSGGDSYITSVSNDFNVVNKKLSLSNDVITKLSKLDNNGQIDYSDVKNAIELTDTYSPTSSNAMSGIAVNSAVINKINNPLVKSNGQVLTYNSVSGEWEAKDSTSVINNYAFSYSPTGHVDSKLVFSTNKMTVFSKEISIKKGKYAVIVNGGQFVFGSISYSLDTFVSIGADSLVYPITYFDGTTTTGHLDFTGVLEVTQDSTNISLSFQLSNAGKGQCYCWDSYAISIILISVN